MVFLFRKKETKTTETGESNDRILRQMVNACLRLQNCWAQWMGRRTDHLSRRKLLFLFVVFIVLSGGSSGYLLERSFSGHRSTVFRVTSIKSPDNILQTGDFAQQPDSLISKIFYQRIILFHKYLDSLSRSPSGKARYDSIVAGRPGLPDTIRLIEKIVQSQFKK